MASPPPPPPALGSRLFRVRRTFSLDPQSRIAAVAAHSLERRQLLALAVSTSAAPRDDPHAHYLLVRSVEEDRRVRHWRFPLAASHAKQQQQRVEPVAALAFSPEGDWLACLSPRKQRLHLVPVATLLASHRRAQLARSYQPRHNREWMSAAPSVMTAPMASYLRATNEAGGLNGARYHSRVAGDDAQMSTLEFAVGMGDVTCCRWWRSMNGRDYCLVGGSDNMISIFNVQDNAEECRCELQHAGAIESIELLYESFRKEKRTSMLVKTRTREAAAPAGEPARPETVKYYRVVLEKKTFVAPKEGDSQRSLHSSASETVVIKTFPEHFVEDLDFRPQRIKKTKPDVRLRAINGLLSTESGLALYDAAHHQISVYGNFQWKLKGQYTVPLASDVADVDIAYCSPDLLLLQGTRAGSGEPVATWLSLPSRQLGLGVEPDAPPSEDDAPAAAHVVHSLSLHDNERVESVLQTTASPPPSHGVASASGEVIYVLQTAHHVYECRPQWSRLALFRALRAQEISLRDALSIGYALGIDMASLCEVVADTVCSELLPRERANDDDERVEETRQWVHDLYDVSRAAPSKAIEQLTRVGGAALAIAYAKRTLAKEPPVEDASERHRVALLVVELIFQQQAQHSFHDATSATSISTTTLRPRETETQSLLEENDAWLHALLTGEHQAFATDEMIELCLSHHQMDKAVAVAIARDAVPLLLQRVVARGLAPMFALPSGSSAVACLLDKGFAHELLAPAHRVVLRSLPTATQLDVALATQSLPRILSHRDWIVRNLPGFTKATCVRLATLLERSVRPQTDADDAVQTPAPTVDLLSQSDVASSEAMAVTSAERVELFLTLLLRINRPENDDGEDAADASDGFSQQALESYLRTLASQYRPPIMITRCVDYGNWHAAASLHEAHGELVDAVECRLQSHQRVIQRLKSGRRPAQRRASKHSLVEEDEETEEPPEDNEAEDEDDEEPEDALAAIRSELLRMVDVLVVHPPTPADALRLPSSSSSSSSSPSSTSTGTISDTIRAAILARLLVKWFEYGLSRADLELHLIDPTVFPHVASPLARIFFRDVIDRVGGKGLHPSKRLGAQDDDRDKGFDERDKAWVRRCHALPFAGQFLFHVCLWLLEQPHHASTDSNTVISSSSPSRLLEVARENIEKNDLSVRAVRIEPHAAPLIGKSDPLETHVKAFTCGHFFPKRVFDEDLVPEFERRMLALPTPLFATRQLLLAEFKRSHVEAPCPVCAFNKISATVFAQQQQSRPRETKSEPPSVYFLHGHQSVAPSPALPSPFGPASPSSASVPAQWAHDEWEWRGTATA